MSDDHGQASGIRTSVAEGRASPQGETADFLRLALDAAGMGWWQWDLTTGIYTADDRSNFLLWTAPGSETSYEQFLARLHPSDRARIEADVARAASSPGEYESEFRVLGPQGEVRWIFAKGRSIAEGGGKPHRLMGVMLDVTHRRAAEEALREREEALAAARLAAESEKLRLEAVMNALPVGVVITDAQGGIVRANGAYEEIWGRNRPGTESVDDYAAFKAWWADSGAPVESEEWASARAVLRGETVVGQILEIERFDGARRFVLNSAAPILDASGNIRGSAVAIQDITSLRRAEQSLRGSEERLRLALSAGHLAIWDRHLPSGDVIWNDEHFRMMGYEPGEVQPGYQAWADRVHPEDRQAAEMAYTQSLKPDGDYAQELRSLWPDGTIRWLEARGRVESDAAGQLVRSYGVMLDITERKRAEELLHGQRELLTAILDNIPVLLCIWDARSKTFHFNEHLRDVLGWTEADAEKGDFLAKIYPDPAYRREVADFMLSLKEGWRDLHATAKDGTVVNISWANIALPDGTTVGIGVDMRQRKQVEEALRESEERYRAIGESIDYGVWICDPEGRNIYASESFLKLVGMTQRQCSDFGWGDVLHPDDAERTIAAWKECVRRGGTWDIEHRFRGVDGQWHPILARGVAVRDPRGKITSWAGINLDISRLKQAEEQWKSLNETLEQRVAQRTAESNQRAAQLRAMAAELSQTEQRERRRLSQVLHDHLQQILVAARMKVHRLQRRVAEDEDVAQIADEVDELIDQCISESRSLTVELSPPVLYDGGLALGLEWLARRVEQQHGLAVEVVADPAHDPADMDLRVFLFQAVRELLFNIVKHAHANRARVSMAATEDGSLRVEVRDDGEGCDPRRLLHRGDGSGGFGLFSVRERLELLGGRLEIDTGAGQGTRVEILVPRGQAVGEAAEAQTAEHHGAPAAGVISRGHGGLRVLLADDHPLVRKGLADLLREQLGIDVVIEARDGQEAVDLALEARPNVVVMDITMPRMDGIEATRRIKAALPQVRVIGLSMHEDASMMKAMCDAGASDYLRKDTPFETLISIILGRPALAAP